MRSSSRSRVAGRRPRGPRLRHAAGAFAPAGPQPRAGHGPVGTLAAAALAAIALAAVATPLLSPAADARPATAATGHGATAPAPPASSPPATAATGHDARAPARDRAAAAAAYGRLPLAFEANRGQQPAAVRFVARTAGASVAITDAGATLAFAADDRHPAATLRLGFRGAAPAAPSGKGRLPGSVSYLTGGRSAAGAPTFRRVARDDLWPGIDAVFYGSQRRLEYDLVVAPGADPAAITLGFAGHDAAKIAPSGDLVLTLPGGRTVRELAPVSYQRIRGRRHRVASRFVLTRGGDVRIALGPYDHTRELVVDPILAYTTYLGGSGGGQAPEHVNAIAVDSAGNAYVTGPTPSVDFTATASGLQPANAGGFTDAFVTKINPSGTAALYSTYLGGNATDQGLAIAVDGSGSAIVTGNTTSPNFPTTPGAAQATFGGGSGDAFVTKLSPSGTALTYSTYLGGSAVGTGDAEQGLAIAVDATGAAFVTGTAYAGFPTTPGVLGPDGSPLVRGAFVSKLTAAGSLAYSTILRGTGTSVGEAIAVDGAGNAYVAGAALADGSFPVTPGVFQPAPAGDADAFVSKLNADGSGLVYSTRIGGINSDQVTAIAVDGGGRAYVAALVGTRTAGPYPTTPDAILSRAKPAFNASNCAALTVLNATATALDYSTYIAANNGGTLPTGVAVDATGTAYVVGSSSAGSAFPTTPDALQPAPAGSGDGFLAVLRPGASAYTYATLLGGSQSDVITGVALDQARDVLVGGRTSSPGIATPGALKPDIGAADGFVARVDASPAPVAPSAVSGAASAITGSSATVAGTVDPGGLATSWVFEYGTSTAFGAISTPDGAGSGHGDVPVAATLGALTPATTYFYRVVATSSAGTAFGSVRSFKTTGATPIAPVAITQTASAGTTTASISGQVNPGGSPTAYTFEFGSSTSFGAITPVVQLDDANALENVSANLTGLQPDSTYYYRVVASNQAGTATGAVRRFDTGPGGAPIVTTGAASAITATTATLAGTVDAHLLPTAFTFAYGPATAPLTLISAVDSAGAFQGAQPVSLPIAGLTPGTAYVYRMVATNAAGTAIAAVRSFATTGGG